MEKLINEFRIAFEFCKEDKKPDALKSIIEQFFLRYKELSIEKKCKCGFIQLGNGGRYCVNQCENCKYEIIALRDKKDLCIVYFNEEKKELKIKFNDLIDAKDFYIKNLKNMFT